MITQLSRELEEWENVASGFGGASRSRCHLEWLFCSVAEIVEGCVWFVGSGRESLCVFYANVNSAVGDVDRGVVEDVKANPGVKLLMERVQLPVRFVFVRGVESSCVVSLGQQGGVRTWN